MDPIEKKRLRRDNSGHGGVVVWMTGLPGSGKSTLALELEERLLRKHMMVFVLDGDIVRSGLNSDLGFSNSDRNENIRRIAEVAAILKDVPVITIVAFISPFRTMRDFARARAGEKNFIEVFVKASLETCINRDPKGMYKKALNNQISEFTGITSAYEDPVSPDLLIDTEKLSVKESADLLESVVLKHIEKLNG